MMKSNCSNVNSVLVEVFLGFCEQNGNGISFKFKNDCVDLPTRYIDEFEFDSDMNSDGEIVIYFCDNDYAEKIVISGLDGEDVKVAEYDEYIEISGKGGMRIVIEELS